MKKSARAIVVELCRVEALSEGDTIRIPDNVTQYDINRNSNDGTKWRGLNYGRWDQRVTGWAQVYAVKDDQGDEEYANFDAAVNEGYRLLRVSAADPNAAGEPDRFIVLQRWALVEVQVPHV